jgi:L-threonylcarbamoyladenylate synthase
MASWPGHVTWLLPGDAYSQFIKGQHSNVACRVPDHAQAREIAAAFGGPMVSTSLNRAGEPPVQDYERALAQFLELVDMVVPGQTSGYAGASAILDINGAVIRGASE